jgi:hypothetical protein
LAETDKSKSFGNILIVRHNTGTYDAAIWFEEVEEFIAGHREGQAFHV